MRIRVVLALTLLWGILAVATGNTADWAIVPSISARSEYNSNLNYTSTSRVSDFIFSLSPVAAFNYTTDISQLQGRLGLTGLHYVSHGELDHIDQNFQINGRYQAAPRWNLSLKSAYIVDSTLQEELLTSGIVMNRTPRQSIQVAPGVTYSLTERLAATVNYNFNKVNYQDQNFQNYTTQGVGFRLEQQLKNETTLLSGNVLAQETRYPSQDNLYRSLGFTLGGNHKFSPEWEVNLQGGINISFMDFQTQTLDQSQSPFFITVRQVKLQRTEVNPFIDLTATRHWTKLNVTGGYSQNQSPSADGSIQNVRRLGLSLGYNFSERLTGGLSGYYSLSNQISQRNSFNTNYFNISPQVTYKITEELSVSPGYSFGKRDQSSGGLSSSSQNASAQTAWVMMTYTQLALSSGQKPTTAEKKPIGLSR
jgi:predicted porin